MYLQLQQRNINNDEMKIHLPNIIMFEIYWNVIDVSYNTPNKIIIDIFLKHNSTRFINKKENYNKNEIQ